VEPLNSQDIPGFHLIHTLDTLRVLDEVGHANAWLQYDIYHMQIMEGNLTKTIRENLARIPHMQLADNPGRNQPGTGEINFGNLFRAIDAAGYAGWIGCEYKPSGKTEDSLEWVRPYLE
jgi:hydroxypyruvate isomerase